MQPQQIKNLLTAQPFVPFRVRMSDGASYDVLHPELVVVGQNLMAIGSGLETPTGFPESIKICGLAHVTAVEMLTAH